MLTLILSFLFLSFPKNRKYICMKKSIVLLYLLIVIGQQAYAINGISILASRKLLSNPLIQKSVDDCIILLEKACQCDVALNDRSQEILLFLPELALDQSIPTIDYTNKQSPHLAYPLHHYSWVSKRVEQQLQLTLSTPSPVGIANGLYGLLQEQLWFGFYHPKNTLIPDLKFWPLTEEFTWDATPRFDKKGFHLHTMHPLELTEPLLNPDCPNGIEQIKEYIDWLARNQQNYFEFNLLENKELERWITYIKPAVDYAHKRGILIGLDLSLHMTQQKAFMLYEHFPNSLKSAKQQIKDNLAILFQAPWDVIAMEASTTEFTAGNASKVQALKLYVTDLVTNTYKAKLAGREHVVKKEKMRSKTSTATALTTEEQALDANRATFIHTVMFYGLTDKKAPVYENDNLLHMLDLLQQSQQERETWYYPESAYWITFDNSVPMLLTPYLQTRLDDILLMDSLGVTGHLTFSSGWEWGYWLIDWSIARWSWAHSFNKRSIRPRASLFLSDLFKNPTIIQQFNSLMDLQQQYIKNDELIRYMAALSAADEMPPPINLAFQPRPEKPYAWWRFKSNQADLDILQNKVIHPLMEFGKKSHLILDELQNSQQQLTGPQQQIFKELITALRVTAYRAEHRAQTLLLLAHKRRTMLDKKLEDNSQALYNKAKEIRQKAQTLVNQQEKRYRYPVELIARSLEGGGCTSYDFGYLYPTSNLHFWLREEEQILQDKYGPFFMSIWDLPRILGIVD